MSSFCPYRSVPLMQLMYFHSCTFQNRPHGLCTCRHLGWKRQSNKCDVMRPLLHFTDPVGVGCVAQQIGLRLGEHDARLFPTTLLFCVALQSHYMNRFGYHYGNCTSPCLQNPWNKVEHASVTWLMSLHPRCLVRVSHGKDVGFFSTQCKPLTCTCLWEEYYPK